MIKDRNYGIDLLRILAMFCIVVLHCLGHGGVLGNVVVNSSQYRVVWLMEICAYSAVDIFAIMSGYVLYTEEDGDINIKNYIKLWLQVVFYSFFMVMFFGLFLPNSVSWKDYIMSIFPVTNSIYWYFTAYTGLFVLMPLLNKSIRNSKEESLKKMFIIIILFFSVYNTITKTFALGNDSSFIWLALLYVLGQIIKKCKIGSNLINFKIVVSIVILIIITYVYKMYGLEFSILNINITKDTLISYISPTILCIAILCIIGFSKMKFNAFFQKIIRFFAASSFSIYLLNDNPIFRANIIRNLFVSFTRAPVLKIVISIVGFSILFVIISVLIDKIRLFLYKILHVDSIIDKLIKNVFHVNKKVIKKEI